MKSTPSCRTCLRVACLLSALLVAGILLPGCSPAESEESQHLEHVIPAHKPADYALLVDQLDLRWTKLMQTEAPSDRDLAELRDIVGWIPELAADSELRRPQWEEIRQIAGEMGVLLAQVAAGPRDAGHTPRLNSLLARLREHVPASIDTGLAPPTAQGT